MSQENVEIVRRTFEQLEKSGVEAALRFLASDVVLYPFPEWVEASEYRGHDGIRRVLAVWTENFDDFTMELQELRDTGDRVVALYEQWGRIKGSGVRVRQPVGGTSGTSVTEGSGRQVLSDLGRSPRSRRAVEAMSQENVKLFHDAFDAFNRRDRSAWLELYDPEFQNIPPRDWPESAAIKGPDAV